MGGIVLYVTTGISKRLRMMAGLIGGFDELHGSNTNA